jgi:mannose-6-phosphate isomerase-like protein (cupin superfamily)
MASSTTDTFHMFGNLLRILASSDSNDYKLSIIECRTKPGSGAPPNRHTSDDECFYVLAGQYEFVLDGTTEIHGPGSLVKVPHGRPHLFTNTGSSDAQMLIITWPGTSHDKFFSTAGEPVESGATSFPEPKGPPDIPALKAIARDCGIELLI